LFIVKCNIVDDTKNSVVNVSVVFYKYIQRARIVKSRRMALLIAAGAFETKPPIYYVRQSQGFMIPTAMVSQIESMLQSFFNKSFRVQFFNISQLAEASRDKFNARLVQSINHYIRSKNKSSENSRGKRA
jgi:hypothetical protein